MIPSLLSISLICGCMPSMAFILMAAVLATAASPSPLASDLWAETRVEESWERSSSSPMKSYWLAAAVATRATANFIFSFF